jgi:hypothetical protein
VSTFEAAVDGVFVGDDRDAGLSRFPDRRVEQALVAGIEAGRARLTNWASLVRALSDLDLSNAGVRALGAVAADRERPGCARAVAGTVLYHLPPQKLAPLAPILDRVVEAMAIAMLCDREPDVLRALIQRSADLDPEHAARLIVELEPWRRSAGVRADLWRSCAVRHPEVARLLGAIADVPWERLRAEVFQESFPAPGTVLRAWLGPCDGKGAFVAVFEVCAPRGQGLLVSVVARLTEGLRDTLVSAPDLRESVDRAVDEVYGPIHPEPVAPAVALREVRAVIDRFGFAPDPAHALDILRPVLVSVSAEAAPVAARGPVSCAEAVTLLSLRDCPELVDRSRGFPEGRSRPAGGPPAGRDRTQRLRRSVPRHGPLHGAAGCGAR